MAIFGEIIPAAQWFVDPVNGSDANNGTASNIPLKTIAALMTKTITPGQTVAIWADPSGSVFKEQYNTPCINHSVVSYGPGPNPLFDCSDPISAGSWSKTGGFTNLYQALVTINADSGGETWVRVWENGTGFARATSQADCDATASTYWPSSDTTSPITLYIHTSDSSNPSVNGKLYEYNARRMGLDASSFAGCYIVGITTRRNLWNDGSLKIGYKGQAVNCQANEGTKHNLLCRAGSVLTNVTCTDCYYPPQGSLVFVYNEDTPNGEPITFNNCQAICSSPNLSATGFYGHPNVSGTFGVVTYNNCVAHNCQGGGIVFAACTFGYSTRCSTVACSDGMVGGGPCLIDNYTGSGNTASDVQLFAGPCTIQNSNLNSTGAFAIRCGGSGAFALILNNVTIPAGGGISLTSPGCTLTSHNNNFSAHAGNIYVMSSPYTINSDFNQFSSSATFQFGGSNWNLAQYRAATGQDAHSTP